MRYKQQMTNTVDRLGLKVLILERMVLGRVPANQETATRAIDELKEEVERLEEALTLED